MASQYAASYDHAIAHAQAVAKLGRKGYYRYVRNLQSAIPLSPESVLDWIRRWDVLDARFQQDVAPVIAFAATQFSAVRSQAIHQHILHLLRGDPMALAYIAAAYDQCEPNVQSLVLSWVKHNFQGHTALKALDYIARTPYLARHAYAALQLLRKSSAISELDWQQARVFLQLFVDDVVLASRRNADPQEQRLLTALQTLHNLSQRDSQLQAHAPQSIVARALGFFSSLPKPSYTSEIRAENLMRHIQKENLSPFVPIIALRYLVLSPEFSASLSTACAKSLQWQSVPKSSYEWLEALARNPETREWVRRWIMLELESAQAGHLSPVLAPSGALSQKAVTAITRAMELVNFDDLTPQGLMAARSVILRLSDHSDAPFIQRLEDRWTHAYKSSVANEFAEIVHAQNSAPYAKFFQAI